MHMNIPESILGLYTHGEKKHVPSGQLSSEFGPLRYFYIRRDQTLLEHRPFD
jgi:hypothetical protein